MSKDNILIIGSSGHAEVVIDIIEKNNIYNIIGVIDDFREKGEDTLGYKVLGNVKNSLSIIREHLICGIFVAIGDNWVRNTIVKDLLSEFPSLVFPSAIHPSVQIGRATVIGRGVVAMAGAVINCNARIGDFSLVNTKASVGHHTEMKEFTSLGPGATTGGNVTIGECSAISIGATLKEKLTVGKHSIIGAGALLMKKCPDNVIMYGVPAKIIRDRDIGEKYL